MLTFGCGHATTPPDIVSVAVNRGATVNVSNVAGASIGYLTDINAAQTALTAGNNVNLTTSGWLIPSAGGVTTVALTGGTY